ncbi:MAG TPA: restriction endonuclease [Chlorobaculum parvum]|uniref:Restriction endonuclease n=1 Tax=Chlorobaculum parvum TaxID=274539 RepID=A0A7C5DE04_9CHLB|nr:restriction endonuclease [Chlorobaculum parvum]
MEQLSIDTLKSEAKTFGEAETAHHERSLYGVTDGKRVGTYLEHKFRRHLHEKYEYVEGSSAKGIDFPELGVDMKVTSIRQPQSSCPFKTARQKVYGLGYSLLVFVYEKTDDESTKIGNLKVLHTIFVDSSRTADFQTTSGLRRIVENSGNADDVIAFLHDRFLPVNDIQAQALAEEIIATPPELGYLTISNALQWRLQYSRVIEQAGQIHGIQRIG